MLDILIYMAYIPYMAALLLFHSKISLIHRKTESVAIAELKVWQVTKNSYFPEGIKYSLFLVDRDKNEVLIGFDNHKPKGHHVHFGTQEQAYKFSGVDSLIDEFWFNVEKMGYLLT